MKFLNSLALAALVSTAAYASPNGADDDDTVIPLRQTPKHAPSELREPRFKTSCSTQQQEIIRKHMKQALKIVEGVVDSQSTSAESPAYRTFLDNSGDDHRFSAVMNVFEQIKNDLAEPNEEEESDDKTNQPRALTIACGPSDTCKGLEALAHADKGSHEVHFCDDFFLDTEDQSWLQNVKHKWTGKAKLPVFENFACKTTKDRSNRVFDYAKAGIDISNIETLYNMPLTTVVHELAHLYADPSGNGQQGITDCFYGAYASEYMARAMPDAAAGNADNYAWFAISHYVLTLCSDTEADDLIRDVGDTHTPSFQEQWTDFNRNKVIYGQFSRELEAFDEENNPFQDELNRLKIQRATRGRPATAQETRQLQEAQAKVDEIVTDRKVIAKKVDDTNLDTRKIALCDPKRTAWNQISRVMAQRDFVRRG